MGSTIGSSSLQVQSAAKGSAGPAMKDPRCELAQASRVRQRRRKDVSEVLSASNVPRV